ncbi:type II toxin-antitoxin system RelE/ParE family toxin [Hydrogenivirga sp. 128-5-R1-1]|uniref:type II toxin-antitoxin system RelE family toxin n=1 Tax=Hydrogenivirga sp. 128-5-R1-1 TaxID=392423 RepID=UPI00015F331C|nr:type II toxin-antitoxin system RelE/ParE family toxin [Hydrogenivirga sp. 128-5-R1-1]EDP74797.1 hypothetical protein HG1285_13052 [Hydrogenivirga sp. 128-5-R1-1]
MKKYGIKYHPKVKEDIKSLDRQTKEKIKKAIEEKLTAEPLIYGERLKGTLRDLWKLRAGSYRVIYIVEDDTVYILGILHRREAYRNVSVEDLLRRLMGT